MKTPVKVNPFSMISFSDWSGLLCTDQSICGKLHAVLLLDILWQALLSDKVSILEGTQVIYISIELS